VCAEVGTTEVLCTGRWFVVVITGSAVAGAVVGVERCNLGMQSLATRVTKAKSHHRWSRVYEWWCVSRDAACGTANLGDKGGEGKEPSSLEPRVGAVVGVERCKLWECKSWRRG
jgi:hypothetical protein